MTETNKNVAFDTTPREKLLNDTAHRLSTLLNYYGVEISKSKNVSKSIHNMSKAIMHDYERRAIGKVDDRLIFCDPDMPVEFIEG